MCDKALPVVCTNAVPSWKSWQRGLPIIPLLVVLPFLPTAALCLSSPSLMHGHQRASGSSAHTHTHTHTHTLTLTHSLILAHLQVIEWNEDHAGVSLVWDAYQTIMHELGEVRV